MRRILPAALRALSPNRTPTWMPAALLIALTLFTTGCGLKGDLFLPDESPATAPADTDDEDEADEARP